MYTILTDSCSDMLPAYHQAYEDFVVFPMEFHLDGVTHLDTPDCEVSSSAFYDRLRQGSSSTTSQLSPDFLMNALRPMLQEGRELLYIAFSSGLSATCNSARIAAQELSEQYPQRRVRVVDTLCASLGQGMLVYQAAQLRQAGKSLDEVAQ